MHQLARGPQEAVDRIGQIAGHLLQPPAIGLWVDPGDVPPAGLQLDHEEDDIPPKTGQGAHLDREEIGGRQTFPVRLQERLPRRALVPLGSQGDPVVVQDPLNRVPGDGVAEVGERAADPRVAPRRMLPRHAYIRVRNHEKWCPRGHVDETLTVVELQLSERLRRSLATTNAVESLLSRTRHVQRNVKRWRGGTMGLRWVAAGVLEAAKGFRRVIGV